MTRSPTENVELPIYEDLVRERGDAVAEAQLAAEHTQHQAVEVLASSHLPHLPSRADIAAQARAMFARTPSVDDIVERAYLLLLDAISARLRAVPVQA